MNTHTPFNINLFFFFYCENIITTFKIVWKKENKQYPQSHSNISSIFIYNVTLKVELIIYFENKTLNASDGNDLKSLSFKTLVVRHKLMN